MRPCNQHAAKRTTASVVPVMDLCINTTTLRSMYQYDSHVFNLRVTDKRGKHHPQKTRGYLATCRIRPHDRASVQRSNLLYGMAAVAGQDEALSSRPPPALPTSRNHQSPTCAFAGRRAFWRRISWRCRRARLLFRACQQAVYSRQTMAI